MASVFSTTATLSCASTSVVPKFSPAKLFPDSRINQFGPFILLDAPSTIFQKNPSFVVCIKFRSCAVSDSSDAVNADEENYADIVEKIEQEEAYDVSLESEFRDDGIEIEIENTGKNSRRIRSKVAVQANLQTLWDVLTDYERLADFIPGLAVSQLLEKRDNFARLFQIGEQNLAFGLKFNAKGTIDCFEKELQTHPFGQKRDIEFKMVEGDFQLFEGKWSIEQDLKCGTGDLQGDSYVGQESRTTLAYIVDVKPKLWLPVRLVEGRLCREIRTNLSCIREVAEKAFQNPNSAV